MEKSFDVKEYIRFLGEELVHEFSKAGMTTHPHSVGSGRENSARLKLKNILPAGVGVGSGFVIDSYGNASQQCDIILYEENFAMKFAVNDDQANTYYNCESVIAVGEVKSVASMTEVRDTIKKLKRIKQLRRYNDDGYNTRNYLSATAVRNSLGDERLEYNSDDNAMEQIFTFLLCQDLNAKIENIICSMDEMCDKDCEYVNRIISTNGAYVSYLDTKKNPMKVLPGRMGANAVFNMVDNQYVFNHFICELLDFITYATTVPLNYGRYLSPVLTMNDLKEIVPLEADSMDFIYEINNK